MPETPNEGEADTRVRLSISQIIMVASLIASLALGWGTLKTQNDTMKDTLASHGVSLANMEAQITQIRIDMAEDRKETRADRKRGVSK